MRTMRGNSFPSDTTLEGRCDTMLLGKLGHELAHIYHDTLQAPLPAGLRSLIERLEAVLDGGEASPQPQPLGVRDPNMR